MTNANNDDIVSFATTNNKHSEGVGDESLIVKMMLDGYIFIIFGPHPIYRY